MNKYFAEALGTMTLVLIGCGAVAIGGLGNALSSNQALSPVALLPIAAAFGLTVTALAYGIGPVSGCHVNPAVSVGVWSAGRMTTRDLGGYVIAQFVGGLIGAALLYLIVKGRHAGYDVAANGLGQNGWSDYSVISAFIVEFVATFLFLCVILGATSAGGVTPVAGVAIGFALLVIHLAFIKATGASVNPARSFGPALFVGGKALGEVWLYLIAPPLGAFCAGLLFRNKVLEV